MKMHIKKGDTVVVLSGKDKGKKGKVLAVFPKTSKAIVEGVNVATKHTKARRPGETGGIVETEGENNVSDKVYEIFSQLEYYKQHNFHSNTKLPYYNLQRILRKHFLHRMKDIFFLYYTFYLFQSNLIQNFANLE